MNKNPNTIQKWAEHATDDELRENLITSDYRGKEYKQAALEILIERAVNSAMYEAACDAKADREFSDYIRDIKREE